MSNITSAYVIQFDDMVKQAYQEVGGKMREHTSVRTGVVGKEHTFNIYGLGFAKDAPTGGNDVEVMNASTTTVSCSLGDKQASEYSNIFAQAKVHFDDEQELVKVIARALGRSEDQTVLDGLAAATLPADHIVAADFGTTGTETGLTLQKIEEAVVLLDDAGVPAEDRILVCPAKAKRALLADPTLTSTDFNSLRPLVNGQIDEFLGFKFVWIGDTKDPVDGKHYGLKGAGTAERSCFAFHKEAVATAVGTLDKQTRIDYVAHKMSYLVSSPLSVGSIVRESSGVVELKINTTA